MESTDDNREQAAAAAAEGEAAQAAEAGADEQEPQEETAAAESAPNEEPEQQAEPEQAEPEKAEPEQAEPEKAEPEQAEPEQAEPEKAEPEQAEPEKAAEADEKQASAIPGSENVEVITPEEAALAEDPLQGERDDEEFQRLIEMYDESIRNLKEGEIVPGKVIGLTENEVIIDVGYKSEGLVSRSEFTTRDGELTVAVGDEVDVLLEKTEDQEGHVLLSRQKAERMKRWNEIEAAYKESSVIEGRVVDRIKGGLTIDVGLRAFLPGSLVDIKPVKNLESLKGEMLEFKVISLDRRRNNIVLSRKAVLEKEFAKKKAETLTKLKPGALLPGVVKNITDYGVFIDLGGIDGLLHITDISWGRVNHPSEHFSVGDDVEVVILKFDPETERVSLGYKQRTEDPWNLVDKKYPIGSRVFGRVVSLVDYGAFVEIEEGVEGLIHVSEMSWTKKVVNPSKLLSVDDEVEAIVSELDMDQRRISLSLRQTERNPWEELADQFPEGSIIEGKVRNLTEFGAFVEITEGIDGLIHVSDMSWTKRVKHPSEVLQKGDVVKARITNIDTSNQRVSLSIKEFMPNEWEDFISANRVGDTLTGRVVNVTDFGLFIDIYQGLEGLAHISEIDLVHGRLEDQFNTGQWVNARILRIEDDEKKVGLTMRGVAQPTADEIMELEEQTKEEEDSDESPEEREQAEAIVKAAGADDDSEEGEAEEAATDEAEAAEEAEETADAEDSDDAEETDEAAAETDDGDEAEAAEEAEETADAEDSDEAADETEDGDEAEAAEEAEEMADADEPEEASDEPAEEAAEETDEPADEKDEAADEAEEAEEEADDSGTDEASDDEASDDAESAEEESGDEEAEEKEEK